MQGLAFFTYRVAGALRQAQGTASLRELVEAGVLVPEPIVYEDFLPRSAAGIFQSNLTDEGTRDDDLLGTPYDIETLGEVIGRPIADPTLLYEAQQSASLAAAARAARPGRDHHRLENAPMSTDFPTTAEITADVAAGPEGHRSRHRRRSPATPRSAPRSPVR